MKVLHFCQNLDKDSGGLRSSILDLSKQLNFNNIQSIIFTTTKENKFYKRFSNINIIRFKNFFKLQKYSRFFKHFLKIFYGKEKIIIHLHGLWMPMPLFGFCLSKIFSIPFILSPHGMLMPFALKEKKFKKSLAMIFYQKLIINSASLILVASKTELVAVKNFNSNLCVKEIPHGINFDIKFKYKDRNSSLKKMLFLGRINPTKGITELIDIWNSLDLENWELLIAGIIEDKLFYNQLISKANKIKKNRVKFIGPVYGKEKTKIFESSSIFILPTKTENFGLVVLEALSYGIPVITTKDAPWKIIQKEKIGWWVKNDKNFIKNAIMSATRMSNDEIKSMGQKARLVSSINFSWDNIIQKYIKMYHNLLTIKK